MLHREAIVSLLDLPVPKRSESTTPRKKIGGGAFDLFLFFVFVFVFCFCFVFEWTQKWTINSYIFPAGLNSSGHKTRSRSRAHGDTTKKQFVPNTQLYSVYTAVCFFLFPPPNVSRIITVDVYMFLILCVTFLVRTTAKHARIKRQTDRSLTDNRSPLHDIDISGGNCEDRSVLILVSTIITGEHTV